MKVTTESGAVYEFSGDKVRRICEGHQLREDGEWTTVLAANEPKMGKQMDLFLQPLCGVPFLRLTTRVVSIEEATE